MASKTDIRFRVFCTGLLDAYLQAGKKAEAVKLLEELVADARTRLPKGSPQLAQELMNMSESLLRSDAFAEAEPLPREGLAIREKTIPPQAGIYMPNALDRLVELYTATNKLDEVTKWQVERSKYPAPAEKSPMPPETK